MRMLKPLKNNSSNWSDIDAAPQSYEEHPQINEAQLIQPLGKIFETPVKGGKRVSILTAADIRRSNVSETIVLRNP
jgi:hypothetical protein